MGLYSIVSQETGLETTEDIRFDLNEKYYKFNDEGHQINHADEVYDGMLAVSITLGLNLDERLIGYVAYYHDIFTGEDRTNHHRLASEHVLKLKELSSKERKIVSLAILEHRSSSSCIYSNDYSLAIQIADTGRPVLKESVVRSFKYYKGNGLSDELAYSEVLEHLVEKFSRDGYGFKCDFYKDYYREEIEVFNKGLDKLTISDIRQIVK